MDKKNKVQIIVHCKDYENRRLILENLGHIKYRLPMINAYVLEVDKHKLNTIKELEGLIDIELDAHITAQMNRVNDIIECKWAHDRGYYGQGVGVAIVDTGICLHKDFTEGGNRIVAFKDFVHGKLDPYDDNGHGSHVSG